MDRSPLQAGPFLFVVCRANHNNYESGMVVIKLGQINAKITPRELGFVIFIVKDGSFAEALR